MRWANLFSPSNVSAEQGSKLTPWMVAETRRCLERRIVDLWANLAIVTTKILFEEDCEIRRSG